MSKDNSSPYFSQFFDKTDFCIYDNVIKAPFARAFVSRQSALLLQWHLLYHEHCKTDHGKEVNLWQNKNLYNILMVGWKCIGV